MTKLNNKQILKKAIEKATKNGFIWSQLYDDKQMREYHEEKEKLGRDYKVITRFRTVGVISWAVTIMYPTLYGQLAQGSFKVNDFIFNHSFAKAFFGDRKYADIEVESPTGKVVFQIGVAYPEWQRRLREIVLEPEPLKYLEKFL